MTHDHHSEGKVLPLSNRLTGRGLTIEYQAICEKACVGLFIAENGVLTYVNPHFSSILGYPSPQELIGKPFKDLVYPGDQGRYNLEIQDYNAYENPETIGQHVFRMSQKDGKPVWVRTDSTKIQQGDRVIHIGHMNNINRFMEVERAYRASLHRYRKFFEQIEDGLAEVDLRGNITFYNQGAVKVWAGSPETETGLNYRQYLDEETARAVYQAYHQVYRTGLPAKFRYQITRKDGARRFVEDSISPMRNRRGKITGFRVVSRDIQERTEAERELAEHRRLLEAIFGSVNDAIITVDPDWKVIAANKATETICGVNPAQLLGKPMTPHLSLCRRSCVEVLKQTLERKATIKEYRTECSHVQHHGQMVSITSSPLWEAEGRFRGAVLVIRDITLLKNLEKELRERHQFHKLVGKSKKMQEIYSLIEDLADLETTVLITGESGTGKDMVARALHYSGRRAFKPFVTVNCSALTESLLESELFGHVKGAFTGAVRDKQGRFEVANGGTLLLDEIGDISPYIQLKLLRVLQEKEYERVGESIPRRANVRVVACTNRDLREKVIKGEFRQDLYYRLKVVEIHMPPLRQRLEDMPLLIDHFLRLFNAQFKKQIEGVSTEVLQRFMNYPWPGNVRELEHVLEHAFVVCHGRVISLDHLPAELRGFVDRPPNPPDKALGGKGYESQLILEALQRCRWNKTKAAEALGIDRRSLFRKMEKTGIL